MDGFHIIPELSGEEIVPRENYRVSDHPFDSDIQYSSSQCGWWSQCLEAPHTLSYVLFHLFLRWCIIALFLYILLLLEHFIIYKRKKDQKPLKHALKKTWKLWILIFVLVPVVVIAMLYISD